MPRPKRVLPYLQKRSSGWYFRFKLPSEIQSVAELSEIRISLGTKNYACARERVERAYPYVLALKRLKRMSKELTPEFAQQVLDQIFTQLVNKLEQSRLPWNQEMSISSMTGVENPVDQLRAVQHAIKVDKLSADIKKGEIRKAKPAAKARLKRLGAEFSETSPEFKALCLDILKLETTYWEAEKHRAKGDFERELVLLDHFRKKGYAELKASAASPTLSVTWEQYFGEKAGDGPNATWSKRTAKSQQANFAEFLEIVGDLELVEVNREVVLRYLGIIAKIPKHRTKRFGTKPFSELVELDLDQAELPSSRTIGEKLIQIRAFLKWCRTPMGFLESDPTDGISVQTESRSYAPFPRDDLRLLFENRLYMEGRFKKSWHFWTPLLALYTGARQNELAQLRPSDVAVEDGIPILIITDFGSDQRVKTKAGIRKVPIHKNLLDLGLVSYAKVLRDGGHERLFPDLVKGTNSWGQKVSRWFNDTYKKKCGVSNDGTGARKVFHSFRHTTITKAVGAGLPLQHCQQVFGHEKSLMGETATYLHQFPLSQTSQVIESLDFNLDHTAALDCWKGFV